MFCPICRSFIDSPKNHCSACGTIVDISSISKTEKQNKSAKSNVTSKRKSKKGVKVKPKTKKAGKKNRQKKKSNSKRKSKKKNRSKKAQKPSAKGAMLEDLRNYISKNPNKKKKSKKANRKKTKNSNSNGKSKKSKKIKPTKTNTTIKSKTARIEYNNGYAVIEGASWNGKKMKKGSFKKRFNGENHGFSVSTWYLGGVGNTFKNKY